MTILCVRALSRIDRLSSIFFFLSRDYRFFSHLFSSIFLIIFHFAHWLWISAFANKCDDNCLEQGGKNVNFEVTSTPNSELLLSKKSYIFRLLCCYNESSACPSHSRHCSIYLRIQFFFGQTRAHTHSLHAINLSGNNFRRTHKIKCSRMCSAQCAYRKQ